MQLPRRRRKQSSRIEGACCRYKNPLVPTVIFLEDSDANARTYEAFRGSESVGVPMTVVQREQSGWHKDKTLEHYYFLLLNERDVRVRLLLPARFRKAVVYCGPSAYSSLISLTFKIQLVAL